MVASLLTLCVILPMVVGFCTSTNPLRMLAKYPFTFMFAITCPQLRLALPAFLFETIMASRVYETRSTRDFFMFHVSDTLF